MSKINLITSILIFFQFTGSYVYAGNKKHEIIDTDNGPIIMETVAEGLHRPWDMAFLPDGRILFTEKKLGRINLLLPESQTQTPLAGVPEVYTEGDGGMRAITLHPDYENNGWIYFSYSVGNFDGGSTAVDRARLDGYQLLDRERIFTADAYSKKPYHYGGRLVFKDGYLYISVGDRMIRENAQDLSKHNGKIIRLHDDGSIPRDNPYIKNKTARPEIWSMGHRNQQGLILHPATNVLWEHEHGPQGGDEINIIKPGLNYGWPVVTFGIEYKGDIVGEGLRAEKGMVQPLYYYVPSIAPSDMLFYSGNAFPQWRHNLFITGLAVKMLHRLVIENNSVVAEERLLADRNWRFRFVKQGLDGYIYIGTDEGKILRLSPAN